MISSTSIFKKNIIFYLLATIVAATLFAQSFYSIKGKSITVDEAYHFLCGTTVLSKGDFRFNVAHPFLAHILLIAPVYYFTDLKVPAGDSAGWTNQDADSVSIELIKLNGGNLQFTNNYLALARKTNTVYASFFLFIFIIFCARTFGKTIGLTSGLFLALSPTIVAHSHFVTNDIFVTAMTFIATAFLYQFMTKNEENRNKYYALFIIFATAALLTKQSALVIFVGQLISLFFFRLFGDHKKPTLIVTTRALSETVAILLVVILLIWTSFKFDLSYYLEAIKTIVIGKYQVGHESFFFGRWENLGWFYHPVAIFIKEPLAFILPIILGIFLIIKKTSKLHFNPKIIFISVPLLFALIAFSSHTKIGIRHVLPLYPFMALTAGIGVTWLIKKSMITKIIASALVFWLIYTNYAIYPFYLTYFNELVKGPTNGYKYLQDSNLDWDQNDFIADNYVDKHTGIIYPGQDKIIEGQKYLIRLSRVFGKTTDQIPQAQIFIDAQNSKKLMILENIGNTHWVVVVQK